VKEKMNFDVEQCPCCKKGKMKMLLSFEASAPPVWIMKKIAAQQKSIAAQ